MDDDAIIRDKVAAELDFDPSVNASGLAVGVHRGVVILHGCVPSHADKVGAVRAAQRVNGVRAVAVEAAVRTSGDCTRTDADLAEDIASALAAAGCSEGLRICVERGWITLSGCVGSDRDRHAAESVARKLSTAVGVTNDIHLACDRRALDIGERIVADLARNAELARGIKVEVTGSSVTLSGRVATLMQSKEAETVAWAAPNVTEVHNHLRLAAAVE